VRAAVLELTSALHVWQQDPSPEHIRAVVLAAAEACGYLLELERQVIALSDKGTTCNTECSACGHKREEHPFRANCKECPCLGFEDCQ
jgi:hypothetical protein